MIWLRRVICDFALRLLSKVKTHTVLHQVVEWVKAHGSEIEDPFPKVDVFGHPLTAQEKDPYYED